MRWLSIPILSLLVLSNLVAAIQEQTLYRILATLLWVIFLILILRRPKAVAKDRSFMAVTAALTSSIATIPLGLASPVHSALRLHLANAFLLSGAVFSIYSVIILGRCFSVFADARGVVRKGPYRLVRHPLYLGELTTMAGLVIASQHLLLTLTAWLALLVIQMVRAHYEERTLASAFDDYAGYADAVQYRVIPGIY